MNNRLSLMTTAAVILALSCGAGAATVPYAFTLNPSSGVTTTAASVQANSSGTLVGAYDAVTNATGTRTKPGLFGTFGETENVPVDMTAVLNSTGAPSAPIGGSFGLDVDTVGGLASLYGYSAMLSGPATGSLATNATVTTASFRTRNPSSTYPGGIPVTIPIGAATITSLSVVQTGAAAAGTITPTATPGQYTLLVAAPVDVTIGVNLAGSDLTLGPVATVLPFEGTLTVSDGVATLQALAPVDLSQTQMPALPLPPIPFDLPTVLPPGGTASVVMNLTLNSLATTLRGNVTTDASGVVVPEPTTAALLLLSPIVMRRRR